MKIFLIRHGQTTGDIEDRYGGWYDDHLTERGREQIQATAQTLVGKGIEIIFTSPLIRAKEAAEIIQSAIGSPVECVDGLKERNYGILTGLTKEEARQRYPDVVTLHEDYRNTDPDGESYDDFCARVVKALETITSTHYQTVALVTHGGPIKCILRNLRRDVPEKINDGGVIELDIIQPVSLMVSGVVEKGFAQARSSGYPTANLTLAHPLDIPEGIYCARTLLPGSDDPFSSIVFYGVPHALPDVHGPRFEVHVLEKNANLYGKELIVELVAFVRENKKFEDMKSLQDAIEQDIQTVRTYFHGGAS